MFEVGNRCERKQTIFLFHTFVFLISIAIKTKSTTVVLLFSVLLSSCGSFQQFQKRKYLPGFYVDVKNNKAVEQTSAKSETTVNKKFSFSEVSKGEENNNQINTVKSETENEKTFLPLIASENNTVATELKTTSAKHKPEAVSPVLPDDDYQTAKRAKTFAIAALICIYFFFPASIVLAIIAYSMAKRVLIAHRDESDWKGRKDARFAYRTGKTIMIVCALLTIALIIGLTIGFCQFLLILGFNVVC